MRLTDYRTMLYLPHDLYRKALQASKRQKRSLAALVREALHRYLSSPPSEHYQRALRSGFGLWSHRVKSGAIYENRLRKLWDRRG